MHTPGLDLDAQSLRYYPYGSLAAHLIGYVTRNEISTDGELAEYSYRLEDFAGQAGLAVTSVDALGYPTTVVAPVSLKPNGDETDLSVAYAGPARAGFRVNVGVDYRNQAENTRGLNDLAVRLAVNRRF